MNIVLVEDSQFFADQLLAQIARHPELQVSDCVVEEEAAVTSILRHRPDAVILDLSLQQGSGLNVLRRIRAAGCEARTLVLTSHAGAVVRKACLEAGAMQVFDKSRETLACIDALLGSAPAPAENEPVRIVKLNEIQLIGVQAVQELDRITELAACMLNMPIATISLVAEHKLWNVSRHGTDLQETSRFNSFSARTILGSDLLEFDNARSDARFFDSPLVQGDDGVEYYAGVPLTLPTGETMGALCVMDRVSRQLSREQKASLSMLALNAVSAIVLRSRMLYLEHEISCISGAMREVGNLTTRDALTSLPNAVIFKDRLGQQIKSASRKNAHIAVIFLDLIDFKSINQKYGHEVGDSVLVAFAERMTRALRACDTVARLNGNRFAVILPDVAHAADALLAANRIRTALREPWPRIEQAFYLDCCMGVALFDAHGNTVEALENHANAALQVAKRKACANHYRDDTAYIVFYDAQFVDVQRQYASLELEIHRAIGQRELVLYCQPQLDLQTCQVVGVEFLVRWNHPRLGVLGPDFFIPYAEQSGLISAVTDQVLAMALAQLRAWDEAGVVMPRISVNVSGNEIRPGLATRIERALQKAGVAAPRLEIEVTETALVSSGIDALAELRAIDGLEISIAVDDFGTGFSSLSRIQTLPISCLKIDRSFVMHVEHSNSSRAITKAIVAMAHALDLRIVVEGVETKPQHRFMRELGVYAGQGFWYARPMAAEVFAAWMAESGPCEREPAP